MAFDEAAGKFENKMHRERKNCHVATRCEKLDVNRAKLPAVCVCIA